MNKTRDSHGRAAGVSGLRLPTRQRGVLTVFTAVLILLMLTLMMFFAVRVGIFEQRGSANEMRQKQAFHAAEAGIQAAKHYLIRNSILIANYDADVLANGTDGWLATGLERWSPCSAESLSASAGTHPCYGESNATRRDGSYFYSFNGSTELPIDVSGFLPGTGEQVTVEAVMCVMSIDFEATPPFQACSTDSAVADGSYFMVTLLARGEADCNGGVCGAEALVVEPIANFGLFGGGRGPAVPLITKSTFPPIGTAEVVANPNGGGLGVPMSVWVNENDSCPADPPVDLEQGSWTTCEMHEWYETDVLPTNLACPTGSCSCSVQESISNTQGSDLVVGIDLVQDDSFPCDLFAFFFGVPKSHYEVIKSLATVVSDCSVLNENTFGIYWIEGNECNIAANTVIGSPDAPVMLISAAGVTRINGTAKLYGVMYLADVEVATAYLDVVGDMKVFGAVIVDSSLEFNGTFRVIYNESTITAAAGQGALGALTHGWNDFPQAWQ